MTGERDEAGLGVSDDWTVTLIAYANGTLDREDHARVAAALDRSSALRRELDDIVMVRRAALADGAPAGVPDSVWQRLDDARAVRPFPPPAPPPDVVDLGRRRRAKVMLAAAAAITGIAAGALVASQVGDDDQGAQTTNPPQAAPAPVTVTEGSNPLESQAPQALRRASSSMVEAGTATFDVEGTGTVAFDGAVLGQPGTPIQVGIDLSGESAVVFGDDGTDYQFFVEFEGTSGPVFARPPRTTSEVIVVDEVKYESDNGEPFTESASSDPEEAGGLFGQLVIRPDVLGRLPELAEGEVADLGLTDLRGMTVRHLRFDLEPGTLGAPTGTSVAEVWISDDGSVRRLRLSSSGPAEIEDIPDATLDLRVDIVLDELGQPLEITAPS